MLPRPNSKLASAHARATEKFHVMRTRGAKARRQTLSEMNIRFCKRNRSSGSHSPCARRPNTATTPLKPAKVAPTPAKPRRICKTCSSTGRILRAFYATCVHDSEEALCSTAHRSLDRSRGHCNHASVFEPEQQLARDLSLSAQEFDSRRGCVATVSGCAVGRAHAFSNPGCRCRQPGSTARQSRSGQPRATPKMKAQSFALEEVSMDAIHLTHMQLAQVE